MMTGQTLGPYRILAKLGEGGMGVVYRAHDPRLDRDVALKVLPAEYAADPDRRARFDREARAAAALNHPNICTIHEIGEVDGQLYIAMELLEGATLRDALATGPSPMGTGEALDIAIQTADALDAARKRHLVHRDLKSANIILLPDGHVKVLDFGLAKRVVEEAEETRTAQAGVTEAGVVVGTVAYMSPEQALGSDVDHRSDLFSFGVVLYELLTGRLPFSGRTSTALLDAVLHQEPPPIPRFNEQVPDALVEVVKKLLEKDRGRRYQSAADALADLRRIKEDMAAGRAPTSSAQTAMRTRTSAWSRWPVRLALAALLLAAVTLAAWRWLAARTGPMDVTRAASLVALPARVQGPPDAQYLTDGVPSVLSSYLAGVNGLDTKVPPTSGEVERFKGDVQAVAHAYRAQLCLISSVMARGDQLVVVLQLEDPATRSAVWSRTFEGTQAGYLTLMKDAADGVRAALRPTASAVEAPRGQTANPAAMQALQKGQFLSNRFNNTHEKRDFDSALAAFSEALRLDPGLAQAAAELAILHVFATEGGASPADALPTVAKWAETAVRLDPRNGRGWAARAFVEFAQPWPDSSRMREYGLRGATLAPRDALAQNAIAISGRLGLALRAAAAREAARLDPLYVAGSANAAMVSSLEERSGDAARYLAEANQAEPHALATLWISPAVLADLGRTQEAVQDLARLKASTSGNGYMQIPVLANEIPVSLERGDRRAAEAALAALMEQINDPNTPGGVVADVPQSTAPFLARHGHADEAIQLMAACVARGAWLDYDWLVQDTRLASLRTVPRFQMILDKSRAEFVGMLKDVEAARRRGEFPAYLEQPLKDLRARLGM
jgi:eukaryotic-like serine/threonine-protein kinase